MVTIINLIDKIIQIHHLLNYHIIRVAIHHVVVIHYILQIQIVASRSGRGWQAARGARSDRGGDIRNMGQIQVVVVIQDMVHIHHMDIQVDMVVIHYMWNEQSSSGQRLHIYIKPVKILWLCVVVCLIRLVVIGATHVTFVPE